MIPKYPCKKDAFKHHLWVLLGVVPWKDKVYKIWECTQCKEAVWEEVNFSYEQEG